jgi:hypothetical protein
MTAQGNEDNCVVGTYMVAFLDVLGQSDDIRGLPGQPRNRDEEEQLHDGMLRICDTVDTLRQVFCAGIEVFAALPQQEFRRLSLKQQAAIRPHLTNRLKVHSFADTSIVYMPIGNENPIPSVGVWSSLRVCCEAMITMLSLEHPIRGSVTVGRCCEMYDSEVYGKAALEAYDLERYVARYPRIVIGLLSFLAELAERTHAEPEIQALSQTLARDSLALIARDCDGESILDYLGKMYLRDIRTRPDEEVRSAYEFLLRKRVELRQAKDEKLYCRYGRAIEYYESRSELWPGVIGG